MTRSDTAPARAHAQRGHCVIAAACAVALAGLVGSATAAPIIRTTAFGTGADAGLREDQPETTQGTATSTELTVRTTSGQNRISIVRFDLTGLTAADMLGMADLQLTYQRSGVTGGTNAGGIKIYGLNPANALAGTWNEASVKYRDAGDALPVVTGNHPSSQPPVGNPSLNVPPAPVLVSNAPGWNSNAADADRAPGIRHENPPYSAVAENTNNTRYTNNVAVKAAYDADLADNGQIDGGPYVYQSYINQPGYTAVATTGDTPDLLSFDRPLSTVGSDFNDVTFLGNLDYDAKAVARAGGAYLSFTGDSDFSPINHGPADQAANLAALVNYLTNLLNGGSTSATFYIVQKNAIDADPLPVRSDNLIYASKEFVPAGGVAGDWAPRLVLAPEPGSAVAAIAAGALAALRRRRRA